MSDEQNIPKEDNVTNVELQCEHCYTKNTIKLSKDIKCKKCENSLIGKIYQQPLIKYSLFTLLLVGSTGAVIDTTTNIFRLPVKTEYRMMKWCIKINEGDGYKIARDNCVCAIESMGGIWDVQRIRLNFATDDEKKLTEILKNKYESCAN